MKKIVFRFSLAFFFSSAVLYGQVPGSTLAKAGLSSLDPATGSLSFQWIATNRTAKAESFFIYDILPAGIGIQSIRQEDTSVSSLAVNATLPVAGPATLLVGPFPVAAGASVTFFVSEIRQGAAPKVRSKTVVGETFALLAQSQVYALSPASSLTSNASLQTSNSAGHGLVQSAVAAPNISKDNQPIKFFVNLNASAQINLSLFAVTGEKVYGKQVQGDAGLNTLVWPVQNNAGQSVASGLYIYCLQISGSGFSETRMGKVLVIH